MSNKVYRLLRNNKEAGPFTAEELIQKNLTPYDLIWIDGRSAAWNYPGELPEFKAHAPLPGEQNFANNKQQFAAPVSASVQAAVVMNDAIAQSAIKQKPRYKVSAAWSKIQTVTAPAFSNVITDTQKAPVKKIVDGSQQQNIQSKSLSWEEAWLDWEKEKITADPMPAETGKVKPNSKKHVAPVLETKYAQPLDDLKDKYIENILLQKQQSKKSFSIGKASEFLLPTIALLVIFSIAYWLLNNTHATTSSIPATSIKKEQPAPASDMIAYAATPAKIDVAPASQNIIEEKYNIRADKSLAKDQAEERNNTGKPLQPAFKQTGDSKSLNKINLKAGALPSEIIPDKVITQPLKQPDLSLKHTPRSNDSFNNPTTTGDLNTTKKPILPMADATANTTVPSTPKTNNAAIKNTAEKSIAGYVNVPEYIEMNNGSANIKIENISDIDLDLVVIDVQYYDASSRFRKGETLYLHNLKAGKNVIIKTSKDLNSSYATSKISLISSDAKQVYVVGDN